MRPIFPNIQLNALQNLALFTAKEHLNVKELSRDIPRYLADVTQLTDGQPHTITLAHVFLYLGA